LYASVPTDFTEFENENFIFLHGEEANISEHVLALCGDGTTIGSTIIPLEKSVDLVRANNATPILAHPAYSGLTANDITGFPIMEILNATTGSSETIWTELLDRGEMVYGVTVDDNHGVVTGEPLGKAWVQVSAEELKSESVCTALETGRFYASTGVELKRISVRSDRMYIVINPQPSDQPTDYVTEFIGINNTILHSVIGYYPSFGLSENDTGYVRAKIHGPTGLAWIQPVKIK
jgi:hypothetical protein